MAKMKFRLIASISCICLLLVAVSYWYFWHHPRVLNRIDPSALSNEVTIKQWQLIGPFTFSQSDISSGNPNAAQGGLNHDFLTDIGYSESGLSRKAITSICSNKNRCRSYMQHGSDLLFDHLFPGMTYSVIYATAEISSTKDGDVGFELGSDDGAKVWLNGQLLMATRNDVDRAAFKYTHLLPVHLKKGTNLMVVKVDQKVDTWALITSFMSLDQMRLVAINQADKHLLVNRLLNPGEPLHISLPVLCNRLPTHLTISDFKESVIQTSDNPAAEATDIKLPQLAEGYYKVALRIGTRELTDSFYVGNTSALVDALSAAQLKAGPTTQEYIQREPLIRRYRILTSDQYYHPLDPDWQKKLLMVLKEGLQTLHVPSAALWSKFPGMHLREYFSKVDRTRQYYLLILPTRVKEPLPLVIVTPYGQKPERPFLESSLIAWPDDLEDLQDAADASGVAVALTDGRGNIDDSPLGEADAFEVLNDINNNYAIDKQRLYLYGTCEGGRRALLLAEHYPGVFSAVGVYGPLRTTHSQLTKVSPMKMGTGEDPFNFANKLSSTPVLLVKGEYDDLPKTAEFEAFYVKLKQAGSESQIEIIPDGMHKQKRVEQGVFPFLVMHSNARNHVLISDVYKEAVSRAVMR
jgi:dienelactone hydrolase